MSQHYDEVMLVGQLEKLPPELRVAFAALCAERLLPTYAPYAAPTTASEHDALSRILDRLWQDLSGNQMSSAEASRLLEQTMALLPHDGEETEDQASYTEDAVAAVAYALRARKEDAAQEAAWAARRAYEAVDRFVIDSEDIDVNAPGAEARIVGHRIVQSELQRQEQDIQDLRRLAQSSNWAPVLQDLRQRSQADARRMFQANEP